MKNTPITARWVVQTCLGAWTIFLLALVSPGLLGANQVTFGVVIWSGLVALALTFPATIVLLRGHFVRNPHDEKLTKSPFAKTLAMLIVAALLVSTYAAIKSLWISPFVGGSQRFVYENTATATTFAAIVLAVILSAIQKDVYWLTRNRRALGKLDERQINERHQVLESSHKIGFGLALVTVWGYASHSYAARLIIEQTYHMGDIPSRYWYPAYNLVIALFALPLIIASLKKNK